MKSKFALTVIGILVSNCMASANTSLPSLECWDSTFAYNRLTTEAIGDRLHFTSSGQDLVVFKNLVKLSTENSWGQLEVSFSVPKTSCKASAMDAKIATCVASPLTVEVKGTAGLDLKIDEKVIVGNAVVQIRRVNELSIWGNEVTGYELVVANDQSSVTPILTQRYFSGVGTDSTSNCETNN